MKQKIRWTARALDDLLLIREYIERDNPEAAVRIVKRIVIKISEELSKYQHIGKAGRLSGTRELLVPGTPYLAVYRVRFGVVEILRVLHSAMKWPDGE